MENLQKFNWSLENGFTAIVLQNLTRQTCSVLRNNLKTTIKKCGNHQIISSEDKKFRAAIATVDVAIATISINLGHYYCLISELIDIFLFLRIFLKFYQL